MKKLFSVFCLLFFALTLPIICQELDVETPEEKPTSNLPKLSLFVKAGVGYFSFSNEFVDYVNPDNSSRMGIFIGIEPEYTLSDKLSVSMEALFSFDSSTDIDVPVSSDDATDSYRSLMIFGILNYRFSPDKETFQASVGVGYGKSRYFYEGDFYTTNEELIVNVSDQSCNDMFGFMVRLSYLFDIFRASASYYNVSTNLADDSFIGFSQSFTVSYFNLLLNVNVL